MAEQPPPPQNGVDISKPGKRIRWATQRAGHKDARSKRDRIMSRLSLRGAHNEKHRESGGSSSTGTHSAAFDAVGDGSQDGSDEAGRRIFFNMPLPPEARDKDGKPIAQYNRNKIRTAKYTPLTFIPKDLFYQFHNIANVYFLSLIVLGVSSSSRQSLSTAACTFAHDCHSFSASSASPIPA